MSVSRRRFLYLSSMAGAAAALPGPRWVFAQGPQAPPATKFELIRRNVGYFTGRGGTIGWMVNKDAVIVVDTQFPDTAKICLDGLKERAGGRVPDLLFNTHHHGDHTAGNIVFKGVAKKIVAHANVPGLQKRAAEQAQPPTTDKQAYADATFDKTWSEQLGDEQVTARHYGPGHTGGDAIIHFEKAQVVHMGDLLFHERHPFIDRPAGASVQNWMKTVETIAKDMPGNTLYIAGHSKEGLPVIVKREAIMRQRDYFDAVLSHVRKAIAGGMSKEETTALEALRGFEGYMAAPPRLTLATVLGVAFDELKGT
jgi:glyoxylase-like metal-dependent hydrolase (beta-lactamase superfamily II)